MPVYSNSKLSTFENCPLQFKFRYLDNIPTDIESIEAFMGKRVHGSLDWLYAEVMAGRLPRVGELVDHFDASWQTHWHRLVHIPRKRRVPDDYRRRGARCLETYYRGNWPFDADRTLALETEVTFALDEDVLVRGFIDRVSRGRGGELIIHDYKTSSTMPRRYQVLADLQLAIYQMGAVERWPGARAIHLVWHFLAFARRVTVQLGRAIDDKRRTLRRRVEVIEAAIERGEMPPKESRLCDWCPYRPICPAQGGSADGAGELVLEARPPRSTEADVLESAGQIKLI